ncbi:MAG TPA: L,D-transpeptidase [Beijerinckiaceae bacterium]|jgi:lipoprotein-anchoring transpeptidase ErfK/SrfK
MRCAFAACVLLVGITTAGQACAQALYQEPQIEVGFRSRAGRPAIAAAPAASPHGGGFIEFLMTGREPTPDMRPHRPSRFAPAAGEHAHIVYGGLQVAGLPQRPHPSDPHALQRLVDPRFHRQVVPYDGSHAAGTVIIDTPSKFLYLVQDGGTAIRYGIGVGRPGFTWAGVKSVTSKREWPDWRPPAEMLKRRPDLPRYMAGGPENPLGARALYLGSSLYRIHGTNEPWTIGESVSSGCIRMMNEDVVDLYERTRVGTKVVVI